MKTDWKRINLARVREGEFRSIDDDGFNGAFHFVINGLTIRCIASDGMGWQHVSVSILFSRNTPSWQVMCKVKDIFWGDDEWVVQFHPPASEYVNMHPGCLHLWRPTVGAFPTPDSILVDYKGVPPIFGP